MAGTKSTCGLMIRIWPVALLALTAFAPHSRDILQSSLQVAHPSTIVSLMAIVLSSTENSISCRDADHRYMRFKLLAFALTRRQTNQRDQALARPNANGMVRLSGLRDRGVTAAILSQMERAGEVVRLARGLYRLPGFA